MKLKELMVGQTSKSSLDMLFSIFNSNYNKLNFKELKSKRLEELEKEEESSLCHWANAL